MSKSYISTLENKILLLFILLVNVALRLIYIFYGYISTEEGSLIYNQMLAYRGYLPFINYNAWNSLLNDYLIGWYQYMLTPTIFNQRIIGLLLSLIITYVVLKIAQTFQNIAITLFTLLFITFGSFSYLYLSNVPFSEQTMTLFMTLTFYILALKILRKIKNDLLIYLALIFSILAFVIRIQGLPIFLITYIVIMLTNKNKYNRVKITFFCLTVFLIILAPFISNLDSLWYSFSWPFYADKTLLYQIDYSIDFPTIYIFLQELFRDYGVFIIIMFSAGITFFYRIVTKEKMVINREFFYMILIWLISFFFILSGIIHKPPYASYFYPAVPLMSLFSAWCVIAFVKDFKRSYQKVLISALMLIYFIGNFISFPHYKFIKTSLKTIKQTPHDYLLNIAKVIQRNTKPEDLIITFYSPLAIMSERNTPLDLNRDRYSMSVLSEDKAKKYHLTTPAMLINYLLNDKVKAVAFTDKSILYFGINEVERGKMLQTLEDNFYLLQTFEEISYIEDPKTQKLFLYLRKS